MGLAVGVNSAGGLRGADNPFFPQVVHLRRRAKVLCIAPPFLAAIPQMTVQASQMTSACNPYALTQAIHIKHLAGSQKQNENPLHLSVSRCINQKIHGVSMLDQSSPSGKQCNCMAVLLVLHAEVAPASAQVR